MSSIIMPDNNKMFFHSNLITRFNVMYFSTFVIRAKETTAKKSMG